MAGTSIILQTMKLFKILTILHIKSATLAIAAVFALAKLLDVQGAILGVAAGEFALSMLMYKAMKQKFIPTIRANK